MPVSTRALTRKDKAINHVAKINAAFKNLQRVTLDAAIKVGKALNAAKKDVPHGQWQPWLTRHFPDRSYRTLAVYMQAARAPKSAAAAHLREAVAQAIEARAEERRVGYGYPSPNTKNLTEAGKTKFVTVLKVDRTEKIRVPYYVEQTEPADLTGIRGYHEPVEPEPCVVSLPQLADAGVLALRSAWERASTDARRRFLEEIGAFMKAAQS